MQLLNFNLLVKRFVHAPAVKAKIKDFGKISNTSAQRTTGIEEFP
jgi:hypothetical protein